MMNPLDICIMTDYNPVNGNIVPGSFVHVTKQQNYISCECDIYKHLRGIAYENQVDMHQEIFLDTTMTCMHCHFFEEELSNAIGMIQRENANLPWALNSVNKSLQYMNDPIQLTGSVLIDGTTKFSIKSQDNSCAFVNITFNNNKCFAKCMNGICSAQMQNRKKIPKTASLQNVTNLCEHMKTIAEHLDYIKSFSQNISKMELMLVMWTLRKLPTMMMWELQMVSKMEHSILKLVCGNIQP